MLIDFLFVYSCYYLLICCIVCLLQDIKMKKMADLQLSVVTAPKSRQAIQKQISQWDENLEKLYIEQYRLRCYMCSLQGSELPNPKVRLQISIGMARGT